MNVDQSTFRSALLDPASARPEGLSDGKGRVAGRRFDVYRNNVTVSLTEALSTAFPVIEKLVGEQNFSIVAKTYLRAHPPTSPLMMFYGESMPRFLETFEPTQSIGYLPDVARLELALRHSYHAKDATPIDPGLLQSLAPDRLMESKIALAPSARLIRSPWPIYSIWAFNSVPGTPKPEMAAQDTLILRADLDPEPYLLPQGGGAFVQALQTNATFGQALEAATEDFPAFNLSETLTLLMTNNALTDLKDC